jgi:quinol monooxygenase YgiN
MFVSHRRTIFQLLAIAMAGLSRSTVATAKELPAMQATLRADGALTTLINVFHVEPDKAEALVALLQEGTRGWICKMPGFVSSTLHVSRDRSRVIIYGQWRDAAAIQAMREHPQMPPYLARVKALATMEAMTCDVASVLAA